jgi:flagellar assembly factor FliW
MILEIETLRFGKIPVEEEKVITFPKGILGFARNKRYILFPHSEGSPFYWLQNIEDGGLAFVVMNPQVVKPDYAVDVQEDLIKELEVNEPADIEVLCIITVPPAHPERMTINLLGPIIINSQNRCAAQIICDKEKYSHRHPVVSTTSYSS